MTGPSTAHTWAREGSLGILTIGASAGNYLAHPEFIPLHRAEEYFDEPGLKGIVIRGSGRHFSAGADLGALRELAREEGKLAESLNAGKKVLDLIRGLHLPVVAEVRGACFGGGLEVALACHIRICSDNALFAFPEVHHGLLPGLGGTIALPSLIGTGRATAMILSGDVVDAPKALEYGLVDAVVPKKELETYTLKWMEKLTAGREIDVIRSVMASIHHARSWPEEQALLEETRLFCALARKKINS